MVTSPVGVGAALQDSEQRDAEATALDAKLSNAAPLAEPASMRAEPPPSSFNDAPEERLHQYALLVQGGGLEQLVARCLAREQSLVPPAFEVLVLPPAELPPGYSAGAVGGFAPLIVSAADPLSATALAAPLVSTALALVLSREIAELESEDKYRALAAASRAFAEAKSSWNAAKRCWGTHASVALADGSLEEAPQGGEASRRGSSASLLEGAVSFRVASLRGGKHSFSSRDLDRAIGAAIADWELQWHANLREPALSVICLLEGRRLLVGLVLPPFKARRSSVLPLEPRHWFVAGAERSHMRPSRAAALVRLLPMCPGETILDPCGGARASLRLAWAQPRRPHCPCLCLKRPTRCPRHSVHAPRRCWHRLD